MNEEQSMNDVVAIDFGTSRTKLAYFDPVSGRPQIHRLGREDAIPSIFYVEVADGNINYLVGERAANRFYRQPKNGFDKVKLRMSEELGLASLRTKILQVDMLRILFQELRERAGNEISVFAVAPKGVQLTQTSVYTRSERDILRQAAIEAGFDAARIETIMEPEAAAQLWLSETRSEIHDIIVLDFGGGTLDWTYLHREGDMYKVNAALPPGGAKVGGENIDEQLLEYIRYSKLRPRGVELEEADVPRVRQEVRTCKEQYCDGLVISEILIEDEFIELTGEEIQNAINSAVITPTCNVIRSFIESVVEVTGRERQDILLIGGCSKVRGLKDRIESEFACEVFEWDRAEFAPVLGAALPKREVDEDYVEQGMNHLSETVSETVYEAPKASVEEAQSLDASSTIAKPESEKIEISYFEEGKKCLDREEYSEAVDAFEQALKQHPIDPELQLSLSLAYLELGQLEEAAEYARGALILDPNATIAQEQLNKVGKAYLEQGKGLLKGWKYLMARDAFKKALAIVPDDAEIYAYIAMAHLRLSRSSDAATSARQALKLDPDSKVAKEVLDTVEESPRSKAAQESSYLNPISKPSEKVLERNQESPEDNTDWTLGRILLTIGYLIGKLWWVSWLVMLCSMYWVDIYDTLWVFYIFLGLAIVSILCRLIIVATIDKEE